MDVADRPLSKVDQEQFLLIILPMKYLFVTHWNQFHMLHQNIRQHPQTLLEEESHKTWYRQSRKSMKTRDIVPKQKIARANGSMWTLKSDKAASFLSFSSPLPSTGTYVWQTEEIKALCGLKKNVCQTWTLPMTLSPSQTALTSR